MARWTFLRHGESVANAGGWLSGRMDVSLTERGRTQALAAARQLAGHEYAQAWSSDLKRAEDTARLVLGDGGPELQIHSDLRERDLGLFEGVKKDTLRENGGMKLLLGWTTAPTGGESHRDLALRAMPFLAAIDRGVDTLIVAHGGLIRVLVGLADELDPEAIGRVAWDNCVPIHRDLPRGRWAELAQRIP